MKASEDAQAETPPEPPSGSLVRPQRESPAWLSGIYAGICLYLFLSAINVMGKGLGSLGDETNWLKNLLAQAHNPFVALMGSVLVTAVVQSSSFTTSLIITLVAAGQMPPEDAVFAVMGANIGTSVTNTIVSFGNMRIRRQFRRAFTAAILHDIFNWLTVLVLFPTEWISKGISSDGYGLLTRFSMWMAQLMGLGEMERPNSPIKVITKPVVAAFNWLGEKITEQPVPKATIIAVLGLLLLFLSLAFMVKNLKGALLRRIEHLFRRVFFRNDVTAYIVGAITTVFVQSSSVTTSLIVPLAGAGAVKIKRVFPYTLGANLGTTITGVIAAAANPVAGAVTVAVAHVTFNLIGSIVWYPMRGVPIRLSRWYARLASRSRKYAFFFLFGVFFVLPVVGVTVTEVLIWLFGGS
ncbi:MAG: Na/Pi symporter [Phycisphaerales bacterium]|nr:MAG: Na/Pi symporter [Phycisphaerales bacterium]